MGALFQSVCYETRSKATDAFFTSIGPQFQSSGTDQLQLYYAKYPDGWYVCSVNVTTGAAATCTTANSPVFPDCDYQGTATPSEQFADGVIIGWGIVAAMAAAFSVKLIQRALT